MLSVAILVAFFYFYASPMQVQMAERQKKLDALQVDISKGQAIARRLPQFRAEVAELESRLETLKNVLPEEKDMADLLRRLQMLAVRSNLTIRRFKPSPTMVVKELHAEVPIQLELDGSYHNLGLFFDRVSKFPRIIHIGNIDIKGKDKQEPNSTVTAEGNRSVSVACRMTTVLSVMLEIPVFRGSVISLSSSQNLAKASFLFQKKPDKYSLPATYRRRQRP